MGITLRLALCVTMVGLAACSDEGPGTVEEHVWQEQTDTLDQARGVADRLREGAQRTKAADDS
jgi:hypothetical protein